MNEKERIIELVRNNIISMDEALRLLEAGGYEKESINTESKKTSFNQTSKRDINELSGKIGTLLDRVVRTSTSLAEEVGDVGRKAFKDLNQSLDKVKERSVSSRTEEIRGEEPATAQEDPVDFEESVDHVSHYQEILQGLNNDLIVVQQRLREYEVLQEIENLTEDQLQNRSELNEKEANLNRQIEAVKAKIDLALEDQANFNADKSGESNTDGRAFAEKVKQSADSITEKAILFSEEAGREGGRIGKQVSDFVKAKLKDLKVNKESFANFSWSSAQKIDHEFVYELDTIKSIDIDVLMGDVDLLSYEGDQVRLDSHFLYQGDVQDIDLNQILELATIDLQDQTLKVAIKNPQLTMDMQLWLPNKMYEDIHVVSLNGDLNFKAVESQNVHLVAMRGDISAYELNTSDLTIESKLGDVDIKGVKVDKLDVDLLNGDILIKDSLIQDVKVENVNGDIRLDGDVHQLNANSVNGDVYLTKRNRSNDPINITGVRGDVKISLPEQQAFQANLSTTTGDIHHRLNQFQVISSDRKRMQVSRRQDDEEVLDIEVTLTMGDIYLKDRE